MAEQGRGPGSVRATGQTTTTCSSLAETVAAATSEPSTTAKPAAHRDNPNHEADPNATTCTVLADGKTPLTGIWTGTADRLASYLLGICPAPRFTVDVTTLADYYIRYCAEAGLRADLLWAQMIHETGYGRYGGDVSPEQNNYAGLGAIGGGVPGLTFSSAEAGVMAHVAHMVAYVYPTSPVDWANASTDPRYDLVNPQGVAAVLADLNGRWAVPGDTYGQSIEKIARAINGGE